MQAFDGVNGTGNVVDTGFIDIQRTALPRPATTVPAQTLPAGVTTWSPANGPYTVTGDVIVTAGSTLTILPGTTVYFQQDAGLTFNGGRLLAEGTAFNQFRFTRVPGTTATWDGIQFNSSNLDNRITYADARVRRQVRQRHARRDRLARDDRPLPTSPTPTAAASGSTTRR